MIGKCYAPVVLNKKVPSMILMAVRFLIHSMADEDEEEVFFGPPGFKEQCRKTYLSSAEDAKPPSPLTDEQMAEIAREANAVANRIAAASQGKKSTRPMWKTAGTGVRQELFKKEQIMSLLTASSGKKAKKMDKENKVNGNILVDLDVNVKLDVDVIMSDKNILSQGKSKENVLVEISHEQNSEKRNILIDIDDDAEMEPVSSINLTPGVKKIESEPETKGPHSSKKGKRKKREDLLVDISDDFEDMNVSVTETEASNTGEESDKCDEKAKKHTRLSTYTVSKQPFELLSAKKRRSLPVVSDDRHVQASVEKEQKFSRGDVNRKSISRLKPPSKLRCPGSGLQNSIVSIF